MTQGWKYYGRTVGGPAIFEIFRFPDNGQDLDNQDWTKYPEWLQPDGSWVFYPNDTTISYEMIVGQFDEYDDEITKEQVDELYAQWLSNGWPGRQRN